MNTPEAHFSHCLFRQANSAIHSQESVVVVEESIFRANLVGVRFHSSTIEVRRNLFDNNATAIRFHYGAPVIEGNLLLRNDKGLFITDEPRDYAIVANVFRENAPYNVVLGEPVKDDVVMSGNWWSDAADHDFRERFFDAGRDPVLGRVIVEPALSSPPAEAGPSWSR